MGNVVCEGRHLQNIRFLVTIQAVPMRTIAFACLHHHTWLNVPENTENVFHIHMKSMGIP